MKKIIVSAFVLILTYFAGTLVTSADSNQLIVINKGTNQLAFYENDQLVRVFRVGTGREQSFTPEGTFRIVNKIKNRPYYTKGIPGGDSRNPLGDRWLGLDARGTYGTTYAIHGNSNASTIGYYVSAGCIRMHNDEIRWLFDRVNLYTTVKIINNRTSLGAVAPVFNTSAKLKSVSFDKKSPQPINSDVSISAHLIANSPSSYYKFMVNDGTTWTTLQDFSPSSKVSWKPNKEGTYRIKVQVRSKASKKAFEDEKTFPFEVFTPATVESITFNKITPQPVHSKIKITTKSNTAHTLYQFSYFKNEKWNTFQEYSPESIATWTPTDPGAYKIRVQVKHKMSQNEFDNEKIADYIVFEPAIIEAVLPDKSDPQPTDTSVTFLTKTNSDTDHLYKVSVFIDNEWRVIQGYKPSETFTWKPKDPGEYKMKIQVKHELSANEYDSEMVLPYKIYKPASLHSVSSYNNSILPVDSTVNISSKSLERNEDVLYRFSIFNGSDWETIQDYTNNSEMDWKPSDPGVYKIKVEVKHSLSTSEYDDVREFIVVVFRPANTEAVMPSAYVFGTGSVVEIRAFAAGGVKLVYMFQAFDGEEWVTLQDYSPSNSFLWTTPEGIGEYQIRVLVMESETSSSEKLFGAVEQIFTVM